MLTIYKIIYSTNILKRNNHHSLTYILLWRNHKNYHERSLKVIFRSNHKCLHKVYAVAFSMVQQWLIQYFLINCLLKLVVEDKIDDFVELMNCLGMFQLLEFSYNPSSLEFGPSQHWKLQVGVGFTKTNWQSLPKNVIQRLSYGQDTPVMQVKLK